MPVETLPPPVGSSSVVISRRQVKLYIKQNWADDWKDLGNLTEEDFELYDKYKYLEPISVTLAASPGVCRAVFQYDAGLIQRKADTVFATYPPIDLEGWFVKVAVVPTGEDLEKGIFLGIFSCEEQDIGGVRGPDDAPLDKHPLDQTFTAYGLEVLLDRNPIATSFCVNNIGDGTTFTGDPEPFEIDFALDFNERLGIGLTAIGNRSVDTFLTSAGRTSHVFAGRKKESADPENQDYAEPAVWSAYDMVNYLYARYVPSWMEITIGSPAGVGTLNVWDTLKAYILRYSAEGKTVKQILDELISRQRGLGWWLRPMDGLEPGPGGETFLLDVFSIVGSAVTVDDSTLPANDRQVIVPAWTRQNQQVTYRADDLTRYGRVRVVGERLVSCFTVSFTDETLERGWTTAEEDAYKAVAGANAEAKDRARTAEQFEHIWTAYRIPRDWDWKAGNGEGGTARMVNSQISWEDARLTYENSHSPARDFGHRLLRTLPLRKQQLKQDGEVEFRDLFACIQDEDGKWQYVDTVNYRDFPGCHVCPLDTDMGLRLKLSQNHLLAKNHWAWAAADTDVKLESALDYTKVAATVAVETDQRLTVEVDLDATDIERGKMKVIEVVDAAMWIVVPGTIVDVNADGTLSHYGGATVIRDDGGRLRQVAALAQAFYGEQRATLEMSIDDVYTPLRIGHYITEITEDNLSIRTKTINTVVTELTYNLESMTTGVQTSFIELDVKLRNKQPNSLAGVPVIAAARDRRVAQADAKAGRSQ